MRKIYYCLLLTAFFFLQFTLSENHRTFAFDCNNITLEVIGNTLKIDHLDGPIVEIQIFNIDAGWSTVFTCQNDCEVPTTIIDNLDPATYHVKVKFYNESWGLICEEANNITVQIPNPSIDSLALVEFYNATDGPNWNNTWDLTEPIDTWYGVFVDENRRVTTLGLSFNNMVGTIPPSLGGLIKLQAIDFCTNGLTGNIPSTLGNLTALNYLSFNTNELTGSIPPQLGNLDSLQTLFLYENNLTGTIPPELGNMSSLEQLVMHENNLRGAIPPKLSDMPNLGALILYNNQLNGCYDSSLYNLCTAPVNVDFSNNPGLPWGGDFDEFCATDGTNLCGIIQNPSIDSLVLVEFYNATDGPNWNNTWDLNEPIDTWYGVFVDENRRVTTLGLSFNNMVGTIPPELGSLIKLQTIDFCTSGLTGNIPSTLGNLTALRFMLLNDNNLTGSIPPQLGNLDSLQTLFLYGNNLTGTIPPELGNLSSLEDLVIHENNLSGAIPPELSDMPNLGALILYNNQLSGCYDSSLYNLCTAPVNVDFSNNPGLPWGGDFDEFCATDGTNLCGIIQNPSIDSLALVEFYNATDGPNWNNTWDLTEPIDTWYGVTLDENRRVSELSSSNNKLIGYLPPSLGTLTELENLVIGSSQMTGPNNNQLTGTIPAELGNLSKLTGLYIFNNNQLSGAIPPELGNLTNLQDLVLNGNELTGNIPTTLGQLPSLRLLSLENNQLTGLIPSELGNLSALQNLWLGANQLTGSIPSELGNLTNLIDLQLFFNQLTGPIPSALGNLSSLESLNSDGNQLSGTIPPSLGMLDNLTDLILANNQLSGCYDSSLYNLCTAPVNVDFSNNPGLPWGGDFDEFCATDGTNLCGPAPCENNGGDADSDGICADMDCDDNDANLPGAPGSTCDDHDPNTTNDMIQADGCTCTGTPTTNDCTTILITTDSQSIHIAGLLAPITQVQIFDTQNGWARILNCSGNCAETEIADGLAAGSYFVKVRFYTANWESICEIEDYYEVTNIVSPPCSNDNDGDGFCADVDCDDNDPTIPTQAGTACDDGDQKTTDDVIQADGCTCAGSTGSGNDCSDIIITTDYHSITVAGLTAEINQVQIFDTQNGWARILNCSGNCNETEIADTLAQGSYFVKVNFYTANWESICEVEDYYIVGNASASLHETIQDHLFFDAEKKGSSIHLNWVTNTSHKTDNFRIERSSNNIDFEEIGQQRSQEETNADIYYEFTDENPLFGENYYRIKQIFKFNEFRNTDIRKVIIDQNLNQVSLYPNPAENELMVDLKVYSGQTAVFSIYNALGQKLQTKSFQEIPNRVIPLSLFNYKSGVYYISIKVKNRKLETHKFIIAKE